MKDLTQKIMASCVLITFGIVGVCFALWITGNWGTENLEACMYAKGEKDFAQYHGFIDANGKYLTFKFLPLNGDIEACRRVGKIL